MLDAREKWATTGNQDLLVLRGLLDPLDLLDPRVRKVQRENGKCYIISVDPQNYTFEAKFYTFFTF